MKLFSKKVYKSIFIVAIVIALLSPVRPEGIFPFEFLENDKVEHVLVFFILSLLLNRSSHALKHRARNIIVLLAFGVLIELIQHFVPNRTASLYDIAANAGGILLFQVMFSIYLVVKKYVTQKSNVLKEKV